MCRLALALVVAVGVACFAGCGDDECDCPQCLCPDQVAPNSIGDLVAESVSPTAVRLTWTAPGDDQDRGTLDRYDIRFTTEQYALVSPEEWKAATVVQDPPVPVPAGNEQVTEVGGLTDDTIYYFAIECLDEEGNRSERSKVVSARTDVDDDLTALISISSSAPTGLLIDPGRVSLYVSDGEANGIHVVSTATYQIEDFIDLGAGALMMDVAEDGSRLYVGLDDGTVAIVDLDTRSELPALVLQSAPGESGPGSLTFGVGNRLYVGVSPCGYYEDIRVYDASVSPPDQVSTVEDVYVAGRSAARGTLYTSRSGYTYPTVTQWNISGETAVLVQQDHLFGGGNGCGGWIVASPDDARFLAVSPGGIDNGILPVRRSSDLSLAGECSVEFTPNAAAFSPDGSIIYAAHYAIVTNAVEGERHDRLRRDLHYFDSSTYRELGFYKIPGYVPADGMRVAADGRLFVLLGEDEQSYVPDASTFVGVGVITP